MPKAPAIEDPEFQAAWMAQESAERARTGRIASLLVVVLMPAGISLDFFVYPAHWREFLILRLLCSALGLLLWFLHGIEFGRRYQRYLGVPIAVLPASAIALMIHQTEGESSPYYAGLNLILLAVNVVVHATTWESVISVLAVIAVYLTACFPPGETPFNPDWRNFFNNLYFLTLTGVIVVTGNRYFNRLRRREFALRYELDRNRRQLEETNQKLLELDQIKTRFFANVSHELRTPLTLLIAPLESLMQRFSLDLETKELLQTMHSNGMRLLKLINDLLALVRLESGRMEVKREPLDVLEFVRGIGSAARQVADDKRLLLKTDVAPSVGTVLADHDKLEKIVLNLVFNALKFTPSGGRVDLRAQYEQHNLVLVVADTGMGISHKSLPFVFDRFWQADGSSSRKYQGVGIGLALVKELTELQGGTVSVESQEGKGTTFTVRLPCEQVEAVALADSSPEVAAALPRDGQTVTSEEWLSNLYRRAELFPAVTPVQESLRPVEIGVNGHKPKILVADDEPDMLRFLRSQLGREFQVLEAVDGQQAIEKATQFLPDVILLDMMMPEKDGLQACREIRQHTSSQSIPIVLLTARADEETKLAALTAGASDFLAKPFSTTELHVRIKNLVDSYDYQRKLSKQNTVLESTIEQLKDTETQLVQSEKLASLGRMSAGIIHEINNPLNFAATGLFALKNKSKLVAPEQRREYQDILKDVEEGITRVKDIVSDLRMFTHPETESRDQVDVAEVVDAALRFLSNEWKNRVQITRSVPDRQAIWGNKNKLIHLLVNLLQNSLDALKSKTFTVEKPAIWIEGRTDGSKSVLVVRDNGTGIDPQHLDKIFDPFYTTKDVGAGMGLGLSICYRIVQDAGGQISVRTEKDKLCEFTLEFPAKG